MSFLFGKKKPGQRDGPTPQGTPSSNGPQEKERLRGTGPPSGIPTAPQPGHTPSSMNNSINSLNGAPSTDTTVVARSRPDPESQAQPYGRVGPAAPPGGTGMSNLFPWSQRSLAFLNPQANPFPRYGAAVNSVSSKDGDIYIMGGLINASTVKGDLWLIDAGKGLTCEPVKTEAEGPGPRVGHASLLVGNAFIVFGGDTKQDENDPLDDTLYLLNTSTRQWSRALPPGPRPAGRYGHTLNILGSKLFVFGGQVDGHFFNDLIAFDLNQLQNPTNRWEVLIQDTFENEKTGVHNPPGRTNHTVITYNDRLYLFGGTDGVQWFNDVWSYESRSNTWTQQDCIGYIPQPREGHSAAIVNEVMYIFGGRTVEGNDLGDLAAFRITSRRWYTFQNMGPSPSPRSGHSMTAFDKQIVVCAGEPSSQERDAAELSLVYILDTSKIRYPNDQQIYSTPTGERVAGNRRPSIDRSGNRVAQTAQPPNAVGASPQPGGSRLPRAAQPPQSSAGPGPPPQQQAPPPRMNGSSIQPTAGGRSRTPTTGETRPYGPSGQVRGPSLDRGAGRRDISPAGLGTHQGPSSRSMSPATDPRNVQSQQSGRYGGAVAEDAALAPALAPQQPRQTKPEGGTDGAGPQPRAALQEPNSTQRDLGSSNDLGSMPKSQTDVLSKETEELRAKNAWYASELAAARKAGYEPSNGKRMSIEGGMKSMQDGDKPFLEALMAVRGELSNIQSSVPPGLEDAMKKIADLEQQRDTAVREAAYAKAKLAAHGGSQGGTPQLDDGARDLESNRSTDHARKLGAALSMQGELQSRLDSLNAQLQAEKRSREVAEDNAEDAQRRFADLDQGRNPAEIESLRAELHEAQRVLREEASQRAEAQSRARILELDKEDIERQLEQATAMSSGHGSVLTSLRGAVTASQDKFTLLENKLSQERDHRETTQRKLLSLRTEHEERTAELETTTRKLRDAEELADKHAAEAESHRQVLMSGLDKLNANNGSDSQRALNEKRVGVLQDQVDEANRLVTKSQSEAELASEKLRRAEERIAGLEAYQQQASREGLGIRKQLQEALRNAQTFQSQHADVRQQLESHQRDANALAIQHGALKDLLDERSSSSAARNIDSPSGGRFGSPDTVRLRELEQRLDDSRRAHLETKSAFESSQAESEKTFQDKIEQLEQDYQSAVSYVKGTEKMLKRMKDELNKSKAQTTRLQSELDRSQQRAGGGERGLGGDADSPPEWESERRALRQEISEMQDTMKGSVYQLQQQMDEVRAELESAQEERDQSSAQYAQAKTDLDKLAGDNKLLESRALDAESKVSLLLDQVESSVDNYRRQSQNLQMAAGAGSAGAGPQAHTHAHNRSTSNTSTAMGHSTSNSIGGDSAYSGGGTERNSLALDNLASELETLRTQWEGAHRSYRLSNNFDFEKGGPGGSGGGAHGDGQLSNSLASWRKRLEAEERDRERERSNAAVAAASAAAGRQGGGPPGQVPPAAGNQGGNAF